MRNLIGERSSCLIRKSARMYRKSATQCPRLTAEGMRFGRKESVESKGYPRRNEEQSNSGIRGDGRGRKNRKRRQMGRDNYRNDWRMEILGREKREKPCPVQWRVV